MAKINRTRREHRELRELRPDTLPRELRCDLDNCPSNLHGERGQYLLCLRSSEGPIEVEAHCRSCGANFVFRMDLPRKLYSKEELGNLLGISTATVDRRVKDGLIRPMKLGKASNAPVRFEPREVLRYLEGGRKAS